MGDRRRHPLMDRTIHFHADLQDAKSELPARQAGGSLQMPFSPILSVLFLFSTVGLIASAIFFESDTS
jgi:hypothetical protein